METQEQEWSKERIQVEMRELEKAYYYRNIFALVLVFPGVLFLIWGAARTILTALFASGSESGLFFFEAGAFFIAGIALVIGGVLLFRSGLKKRQQYNELKKRL